MTTTSPEKLPAAPTPAIARPTIKAADVGAPPHMAEPTSNMTTEMMKTDLMEKRVYSFPKKSWKAQRVNKYALPVGVWR